MIYDYFRTDQMNIVMQEENATNMGEVRRRVRPSISGTLQLCARLVVAEAVPSAAIIHQRSWKP